MDPQPSTSKPLTFPIKRPKVSYFSSTEKYMVINMYEHLKETWPPEQQRFMKTDLAKKTAHILGIGIASVYRILKNYKKEGRATSPLETKRRPNICEKIDDKQKEEIIKKVECMFVNGEVPTIRKILKAINEDESLPHMSRSSLYRLMKHLQFEFVKKPKNLSKKVKRNSNLSVKNTVNDAIDPSVTKPHFKKKKLNCTKAS